MLLLLCPYAEIPYDQIYDEEVLSGVLPKYDWLHLHHEDFTGQYGKFWAHYRNAEWYKNDVAESEKSARALGFSKVSQMKLAVAKKIRDFVAGGGYLFAMCSAPDSFDVALAAEGVDICAEPFDGDRWTQWLKSWISKTFAFENLQLAQILMNMKFQILMYLLKTTLKTTDDYFVLFEFSAKWDPVPTIFAKTMNA